MEDSSTLKQMHDLVETHLQPRPIPVERGQVIVTHKDQTVIDLETVFDKHLQNPRRPSGTTKHHSLTSLIEHAKRHRADETVAYCALANEAPRIVVVYNDNPGQGGDRGGWRDHRALYEFPVSDQWKRWTGAQNRPLSVTEFAELLEAGIADVRDGAASPDAPKLMGVTYATPAELLTLAQGLSVRVEQQVVEQRRLDNGASNLVFAEEHDTRNSKGEPLRVPNGFLLGIPVFVTGDVYAVPVRLRYRVANRQVTWQLSLHDADAAKRDAIMDAAQRFASQVEVPHFYGSPE